MACLRSRPGSLRVRPLIHVHSSLVSGRAYVCPQLLGGRARTEPCSYCKGKGILKLRYFVSPSSRFDIISLTRGFASLYTTNIPPGVLEKGVNIVFSHILYLLALVGLMVSAYKDRNKTRQALEKAWKSFVNLLPDFAGILALVGLALTVISPEIISQLIGEESGATGLLLASLIGAITLIPGFVAFPLAYSLLQKGAGIMQVAVFVSTLMMVGFVTMPLEKKHFGAKATYLRNGLSYVFSFIVALVMGVVIR